MLDRKKKMIEIILFGIFQMVIGEDALIVNYLVKTNIKNNCCYLNEFTLNKLLTTLDKVHIDYSYNNIVHNFITNNYELYLKYSYKKQEIENNYLESLKHIEDL